MERIYHGQIRFDADEGCHWAMYTLDGTRDCIGSDWCTTPTEDELAQWDMRAHEIAALWAGHRDRLTTELYIRFGRVVRRSKNHATGAWEQGLSVYEAVPDLHQVGYQLAGDALPGAAIMAAITGREAYLVTGEFVGYGSDGEPLLRKVQVLAPLHYDGKRFFEVNCAEE